MTLTHQELATMPVSAAKAAAMLLCQGYMTVTVVTDDERREWKIVDGCDFARLYEAAKRRRERREAKYVADAARRRMPFGRADARRSILAGIPCL